VRNSAGHPDLPTGRGREGPGQPDPPARGRYEWDFRGWMLFFFLIPFTGVVIGLVTLGLAALAPAGTVFPGITNAQGEPATRAQAAQFALFPLGFGGFLSLIVWCGGVGPMALRVQWDEQGLEVTRFFGQRVLIEWEEVVGLRWSWLPSAGGYFGGHGGLIVVVSDGRSSFRIEPRGAGYDQLRDALHAHLRGEAGSYGAAGPGGEPQTECKWCGETFPPGATKCPACGRPVPRDG
jgi:hypothetical protein